MRARVVVTLCVVVAVLLAGVPWIASPATIEFGINMLLLAALAQSWNIIGGYTGYPSFGNSVFYGLGSYGTAVAMLSWQLPFGVGLVVGAVIAVVFALLLGRAVLRLRGHYFAICTLGVAEVMTAIVSNLEITGRNQGLVLPLLKGNVLFYELSLALVVVATLVVWWIARSRFGFGLVAIRENEEAAASMGVDTTRYKIFAFAISAAIGAVAGGIHAYWITFIDPVSAFDIGLNVKMIIMAVFGGPGSILGPVVGAFVLSAISEVLSSEISTVAGLFFGIVIVVAVVFMPRGIADLLRRFHTYRWRYFAANVRATRV
ncbi:MAG: branched-chain amino acid ABC transporter permease [Proteobacteria bacterium]|nr:branched-chain amino acid ABC transporter permease [Pseudomonadota bacterium]